MFKSALEEFYQLPVEDVMKKTGYAILSKDTPVEEVLEVLIEFGHIWITEFPNSLKVIGIIARKDFVELALPPQLSEKSTPGRANIRTLYYEDAMSIAGDMMTKNVIMVDIEANVSEALKLMSSSFLRQLPVVRNDEIVGEISTRDLIRNYIGLYKYKKKQKEECEDSD